VPISFKTTSTNLIRIDPNVAKAGGLQSQGVKGEVVVVYLESLTTQDLKSSGFPDVLGRSSKSEAQRVDNIEKSIQTFEFTNRGIHIMIFPMRNFK
jgi:hypothetical protein